MPICQTRYHGDLAYAEDAAVCFPHGLYAFEDEQLFLLIQSPASGAIVFLQSVSTPSLCFLSLPVRVVDPEYRLEVQPTCLEELELPPGTPPRISADLLCLVLLTVRAGQTTTANLLAPVLVQMHRRRGMQVISTVPGYSHEQPFLEPARSIAC